MVCVWQLSLLLLGISLALAAALGLALTLAVGIDQCSGSSLHGPNTPVQSAAFQYIPLHHLLHFDD